MDIKEVTYDFLSNTVIFLSKHFICNEFPIFGDNVISETERDRYYYTEYPVSRAYQLISIDSRAHLIIRNSFSLSTFINGLYLPKNSCPGPIKLTVDSEHAKYFFTDIFDSGIIRIIAPDKKNNCIVERLDSEHNEDLQFFLSEFSELRKDANFGLLYPPFFYRNQKYIQKLLEILKKDTLDFVPRIVGTLVGFFGNNEWNFIQTVAEYNLGIVLDCSLIPWIDKSQKLSL
eukprot:TRINITY_DN2201_c0_g1_i1.p1 TRINITY_DN2201_c0_g1~~TRINITY_DN2201_c0_g1_i1.p1  ORF type:complete len:231 (+),score=45.26 TRINITY_DN2201_c0_g1_i1:54-746(+)